MNQCACGRDTYTVDDDFGDEGPDLCEGCNNIAEDACVCDPL